MSADPRLLHLADEVSTVDAHLGSQNAQAWLVAALDGIAHALVDVFDGKNTPTRAVPVVAINGAARGEDQADRASCAAAATQLRHSHRLVSSALVQPDGIPPGLASDVISAMALLASALQDIATEPPGAHRQPAVRAGAHRSIRAAYRLTTPSARHDGPIAR